MTGPATAAREIARGWTYAGFARAGLKTVEARDDLRCWLEPAGEESLWLFFCESEAEKEARLVSRRLARRLGDLLIDAGCLTLFTGGNAAEDEIRANVADQNLAWWVRFSACCPEQRVDLYADGSAEQYHLHLRLWPIEAIGLGVRLLRAGDEWAARQPRAEAA